MLGAIAEMLGASSADVVLDAGCGDGFYLGTLARQTGFEAHGIAKAGIASMTHALAAAFAPKVRVNAVAPGAVLAPQGWPPAEQERYTAATPLGRVGTPEDVARAVRYLASADYVTGETLFVDGGRHGAR